MAILNPILNDRLQGDGAFAGIRASLNRLAMIVGNIRGGNGVNVWQRGNEIVIEVADSAAPMSPFKVYQSTDAEGDAAWRTVRVHSGTINGIHPDGDGDTHYSDDTDVDESGDVVTLKTDMELEADSTYYIVAVQTRDTSDWSLADTYLFFVSDAEGPAFPGQSDFDADGLPTDEERSDVFRNAYYRTIGTVITGSDDEAADDYQELTINQLVTSNIETGFAAPDHQWEPVVTVDDPDAPMGDATLTVQSTDDDAHAGDLLEPGGQVQSVDAYSEGYTPETAISGWLQVSITTATGDVTAEVVTEDPSGDIDPYDTTTAVLVFPLFEMDDAGGLTEHQAGDISLAGLISFADKDDTPKEITPDEGTNGAAENHNAAKDDHSHKLDLTTTGFDGLDGEVNITVVTSYSAGSYTFTTRDLTFKNGLLTANAEGTPIVLSTTECSGT